MSPDPNESTDSSASSTSGLPDDLVARLSRLDDSELRAVISYARSLLPPLPTVEDLLEERPGEEILEISEGDGYTKVVKTKSCTEGCEECPHGPYLYHVRVEPNLAEDDSPSLHWEFLGPIQ